MPKLTHGKQAANELEQGADAKEALDKDAQHDKGERREEINLKQAAQQARLAEVHEGAGTLRKEIEQSFSQLERALAENNRRPADSFQSSGPGGASQAQRDDLRRSQDEVLDKERMRETQAQLAQARASAVEAADRIAYAAKSMSTRHEATFSEVRSEHAEALAKTAQADQASGTLTAAERVDRQREREARVDNDVAKLVRNQAAEIERMRQLLSDTESLSRAFVQGLQNDVTAGTAVHDRLEQFNDKRDAALATAVLWNGCLSDIEVVRKTWEKAAADLSPTADGFATARARFWKALNAPEDEHARQARTLFEHAGVEWQTGSNAPLLAVESRRLDDMRQGAERDERMRKLLKQELDTTRITIDHAADKKTHPSQTLDPANLRLMTNSDNSARGHGHGVSEGRKVDLEKSREELNDSAKQRDYGRGRAAEKSHDRQETKTFALLEQQLEQQQARAAASRAEDLRRANDDLKKRELELRDREVRPLDGESEDMRRARQQDLQEVLARFQRASRAQLEELQASERRLDESQRADLQQAQQALAQPPAAALLALEKDLLTRFGQDQIESEALRKETEIRRREDGERMLNAIYAATTRASQEEAIGRAFARQRETAEALTRLREERDRRRHDQD